MPQNKTYTPTYKLKQFGENIWIVDGGEIISFYGLPFTTRMTIIKLPNGDLWIHSPINLPAELKQEIDNLGTVKHIIAPNKIHYWYIDEFKSAYPSATVYASPGVRKRAAKYKPKIHFDKDLIGTNPATWKNQIEQVFIEGSRFMDEVVFFHKISKTLVVTDFIENFEASKINPFFRVIAWIGGALHPNGGTTIDQQLAFLGNRKKLQSSVQKILEFEIEKIILAHGKCITKNGKEEFLRIVKWTR